MMLLINSVTKIQSLGPRRRREKIIRLWLKSSFIYQIIFARCFAGENCSIFMAQVRVNLHVLKIWQTRYIWRWSYIHTSCEKGGSMLNHLSVIKKIVLYLQAMELDYDEEDLGLILLCSLPSSFANFRDIWYLVRWYGGQRMTRWWISRWRGPNVSEWIFNCWLQNIPCRLIRCGIQDHLANHTTVYIKTSILSPRSL